MPSDLEEGQQWVFSKARAIAKAVGLRGEFVWGPQEDLKYPLKLTRDGVQISLHYFPLTDLEFCAGNRSFQEKVEQEVRAWLEGLVDTRKTAQ